MSLLLLAVAVGGDGCSVLNRVDVCERVTEPDFTVNARVDQDQIPSVNRSVTRLSNGLYAAAWISTEDTDPRSPSEVRVGLFSPEGRLVPSCRTSLSERSLTGSDEVAYRPAIAANSAASSPVYVVWQSRRRGDPETGPFRVRAAILDVQLCSLGQTGSEVVPFDLSDATFDRHVAPTIAVRADGREALAVWIGQRSDRNAILARPLGVANDPVGRAERNGCDGSPAPCEIAVVSQSAQPAITATRDGYLAAWSNIANVGGSRRFDLRWQRFDESAQRRSQGVLPELLDDLGLIFLSLASDRDGWALGWSAVESGSLGAQRDSDVWIRRFDAADAPRGPAVRVNDRVDGVQAELSIASLGEGALFAAWTDRGIDGRGSEVRARVIGPDDQPLFNAMACDDRSFVVSGLPSARRRVPSVIAAGDELLAVYGDSSGTDPDRFGESVRARRFSISRLLVRRP
jgi:hypothetical protein